MTSADLQSFTFEADPQVVAALGQIAQDQGRQLHEVLDVALRDYIACHAKQQLRQPVSDAFTASQIELDTLYRKLAE